MVSRVLMFLEIDLAVDPTGALPVVPVDLGMIGTVTGLAIDLPRIPIDPDLDPTMETLMIIGP